MVSKAVSLVKSRVRMECKATSDLLLTMTSNQDQLKEQFPEAYRDFSIDKLFATLAEAIDKDDLMPASKAALLGKLCRYPHKKTANKVYLGEKTLAQALQAEVFPAIDSLYENKKLYIEEKYLENSLNKEGKEEIKIKWRKVDYSEILKQFKTTLENSKIFDYCDILNQLRDRCIELFNQEKLLTTNSLIAKQGMTFHINDLFVPLGLVERQRPSKRQDIESADLGSQLYQPTEDNKTKFDDQQQFFDKVIRDCNTPNSQGKRIAIIGEAGSGKTTLLQKIGDKLLENYIPIWISLKRLGNQSLHQYLSEDWLRNAAEVLDNVPEKWKTALEELLKSNQVFLLLDGVDEMTTTSHLQAIGEQINQCKIFDSARVILTCRSNLWEDYALPGFDAYQNLYFDYPTQVEQFIDQFFQNSTENKDLGETLKTELRLENKYRIRDLVKNPLRLFLLCYVWILGEGQLPDTQAELYKLFVDNFYKVYQLKGSNFTISVPKRKQLERGLGELSKKALDDKKFLLPKSVIEQYLGDPDDQDSLFYLGKKLNLLNCVDKCAGNPFEDAYAFLHSTFQEYFAALVIDDWRKEFLNHVPHNPKLGIYRIFEPQWKQVILFWLGRKNVDDNEKEKFIESLVVFADRCNGFYWYKAYFLAANGMAEFHNFSKGKEIVTQVVNWAFMNNNTQILESIKGESRKILLETNNNLAIFRLLEISEQTSSYLSSRRFFSTFQKICFGNQPYIIDELTKLLRKNKQYQYKCCELLKLIALMGNGNNAAIKEISNFIDELEKLIEDEKNHLIEEDGVQYCKYQDTLIEAARTLGIIDFNNSKAIRILIELSKRCNNKALKAISEIHCESDDNIVNVLIDIINQNDDCNSKINSLQALTKLQPNHSILVPELLNIITPTLEEIALRDRLAKIQQQLEYNFEEKVYLDLELEFVYLELPSMQGFEENRKIALDALEEICKNNPHQQTNIIYELFELIYQCSDRTVIQEIIKSLARMGNHPIIIARFEKMLESKSKFNDYTLLTVAEGLKQIDRENQKASQTLVEMLDSKDKTLCILASNILGKLEIKEDDAIRALENKIESTDNSNIQVKVKLIYNLSLLITNHYLVNSIIGNIHFNDLTEEEILTVAYDLSKIKEEKNILFNKLLELTFAKDRPKKLKNICFYLHRMITRENAKKIIHSYRNYFSNQAMSKNCKNSHEIDTLLWRCAQHMSYPEFYQAWHEPNQETIKQLETTYNDIGKLINQLQPTDQVYPILIDGKYSLEHLTDESAIAQELCNQIYEAIFPDDDIPTVKNAPELKRLFPKFKRQVNRLTLVFIIYNIEPYPELINVCRQLLGKFHIAFITDQEIEPDLRGFPMQNNLVNILQNWLTEISYKETL